MHAVLINRSAIAPFKKVCKRLFKSSIIDLLEETGIEHLSIRDNGQILSNLLRNSLELCLLVCRF